MRCKVSIHSLESVFDSFDTTSNAEEEEWEAEEMQTLNNLFFVLISRSIPFRRWLFISFCLSQLSFFWQIHIHTLKAFLSEKWMRSKYLRRHLVSYFLNEGPAHCFRHWLFGYKQTILQKCTLLKSIIKYISKAINQMRRVRAREKKPYPNLLCIHCDWIDHLLLCIDGVT